MRMNDEEVLSACLCTAARLLHSVLHVFARMIVYTVRYCTCSIRLSLALTT